MLEVAGTPTTLTTDQNTPATFLAKVQTSFADTYTLTANAPSNWTVSIDSSGNVMVTPAPGLQAGTYPVQIIAQSQTDPDLEAQSTVEVTVTPTQPAIALSVAPDAEFTVPLGGAQVPTAFRATIQNLGPAAETVDLSFSNVPAGFTLLSSTTSVTIPAGQTAIVGIYLQPQSLLPAAETQLAFTVTATSTTDPTLIKSQTESFTVPAIGAVTVTGNPATVDTTPGVAGPTTVVLSDVGNEPETVTVAAVTSTGLSVTGLSPVSLMPGQSTIESITLTPVASTPLTSTLLATLTATFGPAASPVTQTLVIPVNLVVPGAAAIASASTAADQLGNTSLANPLSYLSTALTNLVQNPASSVYQGQAQASLAAVNDLLGADRYLAPLVPTLTSDASTLAQATTAAAVQTAVTTLGNDLGTAATTRSGEAASGFTLSLPANSQVVQPQVPASFTIVLQNIGNASTTYDLSLSDLPAGVTGTLSPSSITLGPGQVTPGSSGVPEVTVTLTSTSATSLAPFSFTVTATAEGALELTQSIAGSLQARTAFVEVTSVTPNPAFTNPGGQVDVSARLLNAVNMQQQAEVSYTVTDASGDTLFSSPPVSTTLNVLTTLSTVDLGNLDTTNFSFGDHTITVTVSDASGTLIPGATGTGTLLIGTPVTASLTTAPESLPAGSGTVASTLQINSQSTFPAPLTLEGQMAVASSNGVAVSGTTAYVATSSAIDVVDVSNPAKPKVLSSFGSGTIPGGHLITLQVSGSELVVVGSPNGGTPKLLIYSITNPTSPSLVGQTPLNVGTFNYQNLVLSSVANGHAYTASAWFRFNSVGNVVTEQFGQTLDVDISNPAAPTLDSEIYNSSPNQSATGLPDGTSNVWQAAAVNTDVLLLGSTTATGGNVNGTGEVLVVDTTDNTHPSLIEKVPIPGMEVVTGIAISGNTAFLIGSSGGWASGGNVGLCGNLVVAQRDLTNPQSPTVVSTQTLSIASIGISQITSLGNGL